VSVRQGSQGVSQGGSSGMSRICGACEGELKQIHSPIFERSRIFSGDLKRCKDIKGFLSKLPFYPLEDSFLIGITYVVVLRDHTDDRFQSRGVQSKEMEIYYSHYLNMLIGVKRGTVHGYCTVIISITFQKLSINPGFKCGFIITMTESGHHCFYVSQDIILKISQNATKVGTRIEEVTWAGRV